MVPDEQANRTETERLRQALEERNAQLDMIRATTGGMKGSLDDPQYTYFYVNDELCAMLGYTHEEFMEMSGGTAAGAVYPPDRERVLDSCARCFAQGSEYRTEYRMRKKDGTLVWVLDTGRKSLNPDGKIVINSIITDISALKEALEQLKVERQRYEIVAELSHDIIFDYSLEDDTLQIFHPIGMEHKERYTTTDFLRGKRWQQSGLLDEDMQKLRREVTRIAEEGGAGQVEFRLGHSTTPSWQRIEFKCVLDPEGKLLRVVGRQLNIESERDLLIRSRTDPLTGAFNRLYLEQEADKYLLHRSPGMEGACMMVDVDRFKQINDTCGHLVGDELLRALADTIRSMFRAGDITSRIGGDEFMVFLRDLTSLDAITAKGEQLLKRALAIGQRHGLPVPLSLSIGVTVSRSHTDTFQTLYRQADIALYQAKAAGRSCLRVYEKNMHYPVEHPQGG